MPKSGSFEVALQKLEKIVSRLEEGEISLEESLKSFEEGMRLAKICDQKLGEFEKKIEILMKEGGGKRQNGYPKIPR